MASAGNSKIATGPSLLRLGHPSIALACFGEAAQKNQVPTESSAIGDHDRLLRGSREESGGGGRPSFFVSPGAAGSFSHSAPSHWKFIFTVLNIPA